MVRATAAVTGTYAILEHRLEPNLRGHFTEQRLAILPSRTSPRTEIGLNSGVINYNVLPGTQADRDSALGLPTGVCWSADGQRVYVASLATNKIGVVNPGTGGVVATIPAKHPGRLLGGGVNAARLLATVRALPPAGPPPDLENPEMLRQMLLALALRDESIGAAEAVDLADRALDLARADHALDPPAALEAAKRSEG